MGTMRTILLGTIAMALSLAACTKQESEAQRNAEIERRVQERLATEHQVEADRRLALRAAALDAREKMLAAQESSFATMTASSAPPSPALDEPTTQNTESYSSPDYATYPAAGDAAYGEDYGYVTPNEPGFADEPYFATPDPYYVTVFNQNAAVIYSVRNRNRGRFHHRQPQRSFPQTRPRQMQGPRSMTPARPPMRSVGRPTVGVTNNRPGINRGHTIAPRRTR